LGDRRWRFKVTDWVTILRLLQQGLSPDQITGRVADERGLRISHETIYRLVWRNHERGGDLWRWLRGANQEETEARRQLRAPEAARGETPAECPVGNRRSAGADRRLGD
jgi:IS30 family transposase